MWAAPPASSATAELTEGAGGASGDPGPGWGGVQPLPTAIRLPASRTVTSRPDLIRRKLLARLWGCQGHLGPSKRRKELESRSGTSYMLSIELIPQLLTGYTGLGFSDKSRGRSRDPQSPWELPWALT